MIREPFFQAVNWRFQDVPGKGRDGHRDRRQQQEPPVAGGWVSQADPFKKPRDD